MGSNFIALQQGSRASNDSREAPSNDRAPPCAH